VETIRPTWGADECFIARASLGTDAPGTRLPVIQVVCFPYEITLPSDADTHFGLDMLKRVVLNSNPPPMLA